MHRSVQLASNAGSSGRNVVAVIGIDRYAMWRGLDNAVSDATGALSLFRRLGFEQVTTPLLDERATREAVTALVTDELTALGSNDSLVLFFAGHGGTRTQRVGGKPIKTGYLIPADGCNDPNKVATWIELDAWLRNVSKLPPRHILVILDACYSGVALSPIVKWGREGDAAQAVSFSTLQARHSRLVITSALDDEVALDSGPVLGHSLFTGCLIEGLTGGLSGDLLWNGRRVATASDIGRYVRRRVQTYPGRPGWRQTPDFGSFDFDDRGEMLVPLLVQEAVSTASAEACDQAPTSRIAGWRTPLPGSFSTPVSIVRPPTGSATTAAASVQGPGVSGGRVGTARARLGMVVLAMVSTAGAGVALVRCGESAEGTARAVPTSAQTRAATSDDAGVSAAVPGDGPSQQPLVRFAEEPEARARGSGEVGDAGSSAPACATSNSVDGSIADRAFLSGRDAGPNSPPVRNPEPAGMIRVLGDAQDARAFLDGKDAGPIPVDISSVKPGAHIVQIRAPGFQSSERHVKVTAGGSKVVKFDRSRELPSDTGTLKVASAIPGAVVSVDGVQFGRVPQEQPMAQGDHAVAVRLDGYRPFEQKVRVETGQVTMVQADLTAVGRLRVLSTPGKARVTLNGAPAGVTPLDIDVPLGKIRLRIDLTGFVPFERTLTVCGSKTETIWRELVRAAH